MKTAWKQVWEESEKGWGTRPDGFTIHKSLDDHKKYIDAYWATMPDEVPEEYSRPCSDPHKIEISDEVFESVTGNGIWFQNDTAYANHKPQQ